MSNWKVVETVKTVKRSEGNFLNLIPYAKEGTFQTLYFSAGLRVKPGSYDLVSCDGLLGFRMNANGAIKIKQKKGGDAATTSSRSLMGHLKTVFNLSELRSYKFKAWVNEEGIIVFNNPV